MRIRPRYLRIYVTLLAALIGFSLRETFAQSLGDLARQERARKLARQSRVTKVYTNEDLQREVIVDPNAAAAQETVLADTAPAEIPAQPVPVHLTLAPAAIPAKEIAAPVRNTVERAVPTVPVWPAGMPLGDVARYYRQQIAPQIPADDTQVQDALAQQPTPKVISELNLPAPFVMASAEGSSIPVIENVAGRTLPGFPSPAVKLELASNAGAQNSAASTSSHSEGLRFEAPQIDDVVLSFDSNASFAMPSIGSDFSTPIYDSSGDALTIRFAAPQRAAATAAQPAPIARTAEVVNQPEIGATLASTSSLETVSPWRYADEIPPAPAQPEPARSVVASTTEKPAGKIAIAQTDEQEVRVQRGDSLWLLALRHLGDGNSWPQIAAANPQIADPDRILVGERLMIPGGTPVMEASHPTAHASQPVGAAAQVGRSVSVRQGDSLWKLAESALGNGTAWNCIAAANPQITDANRIFAGQTLVLPSDCNSRS